MKYYLYTVFTFLLLFGFNSASAQSEEVFRLKTVCLDAGHGGRDPGAVYKGLYEKKITLAVTRKLGKLIEDNYKDVKVVYTRRTDIAVPLYKRAEIANKADANLFISIHVNSCDASAARGTETFALGFHRTKESLKVAMKENAAMKFEDGYEVQYSGFEPNRAESYIMFNLMQNEYRNSSLDFGAFVEKNFVRIGRKSRDVKEAGILVLARTAMPAVLVELGFITNYGDRTFLKSNAGQNKMANALFKAFAEYKKKVEKPLNLVSHKDDSKEGVHFSVQIASSPNKMNFDKHKVSSIGKVREESVGKSYKYYIGECREWKDAVSLQNDIRKIIKDCFVVAFSDGKRISVREAKRILEK